MDNTRQILTDNQLMIGRMISGSKSGYREKYPNNFVVFNANILTEKSGKIYYGDLDLDFDNHKLLNVAKQLNEDLYILKEMDCRFENEDKPIKELIKKAVAIIKQTGEILKK